MTVPQPNVSRNLPIKAVFERIKVNQQITGSGMKSDWTGGTTLTSNDAETLAKAVENYIRTSGFGALRMPSEICNVPAIADFRPGPTINPTRNDLVRQTVGALTTQGNVFSVWTVGQAILKKPNNAVFGEFESGDSVLAETRMHFLVERYLDPGADGVYGNSVNPGTDNVVGSSMTIPRTTSIIRFNPVTSTASLVPRKSDENTDPLIAGMSAGLED